MIEALETKIEELQNQIEDLKKRLLDSEDQKKEFWEMIKRLTEK